jgi:hypothetical protein
MFFDDFIDERSGVKSSSMEESDNSMKINNAKVLEHCGKVLSTSSSYFTDFTTKTFGSCHKDNFLIIMSQTITNNAIITTTKDSLSPLWRGHRNFVQRT